MIPKDSPLRAVIDRVREEAEQMPPHQVHIHTHTHTHTHIHTHIHTRTHTHARARAHTHTQGVCEIEGMDDSDAGASSDSAGASHDSADSQVLTTPHSINLASSDSADSQVATTKWRACCLLVLDSVTSTPQWIRNNY